MLQCGLVGSLVLAPVHADPLAKEDYDAGELRLLSSVAGDHPFYRVWPDNGRRDDDPLRLSNEVFEKRVKHVARPSIMWMKPEKPNGMAVLLFPGGGYRHLAAAKEGSHVGEWLNKQGITAFVVKYRVPMRKGVNAPLQDAQRAIRLVRGNAKRFGINPHQVGVMGFSAGGHLCALSLHHFDDASYDPIDRWDKISCKPDFGVLIYPAYLGKKGAVDKAFSQVADPTIPIYIAISKNDGFHEEVEAYVPVLKMAKVDCAYHAYPDGGHGTGLGGFPWTVSCKKWLSSVRAAPQHKKSK